MGDLLEELEMLVGVVGGHVGELGVAGVGLGLGEDMDEEGDREAEKGRKRGGARRVIGSYHSKAMTDGCYGGRLAGLTLGWCRLASRHD